jgi:hypothetical protein
VSDRREHASLALEAGKHVLVEKPIGCSLGDARIIAEKVGVSMDAFLVSSGWESAPWRRGVGCCEVAVLDVQHQSVKEILHSTAHCSPVPFPRAMPDSGHSLSGGGEGSVPPEGHMDPLRPRRGS